MNPSWGIFKNLYMSSYIRIPFLFLSFTSPSLVLLFSSIPKNEIDWLRSHEVGGWNLAYHLRQKCSVVVGRESFWAVSSFFSGPTLSSLSFPLFDCGFTRVNIFSFREEGGCQNFRVGSAKFTTFTVFDSVQIFRRKRNIVFFFVSLCLILSILFVGRIDR